MKQLVSPLLLFLACAANAQRSAALIPEIDGAWWQIASNPDLGKYNGAKQQPVDFGIWQAGDGTWQLWSCIRGTQCPGNATKRLLYGWEGKNLTDKNWEPRGITWLADTTVGETNGGMQAPFVYKDGDFNLFYGDWRRICLATSQDGKHFKRMIGKNRQPDLFTENAAEPRINNTARDPMILKRGNTFYCYYTSHTTATGNSGAAYVRTSFDMIHWSESVMVSRTPPFPGNSPRFSDECPFVVYLKEVDLYYLFVTQAYGKNSQTTVYASPSPMYFGIDNDRYKVCTLPVAAPELIQVGNEWFIASTMPGFEGIYMAKLKWISNQK